MNINYTQEYNDSNEEWIDFVIDDQTWDCYYYNDTMHEYPLKFSRINDDSYTELCKELCLIVIPLLEFEE